MKQENSTDGVTACGNTPYDEGPFTIDQERTAFEAAMRVKHPEWAFTPDPVFDYHNERTRCAWEGWQAAIASGVAEVGVVRDLDDAIDRVFGNAGVAPSDAPKWNGWSEVGDPPESTAPPGVKASDGSKR